MGKEWGPIVKGDAEMTSTTVPVQPRSLSQKVWQSFMSALGSIVFGMEDGTVSIFGLVFGVAASATNSQMVLLAGATGAISAAVSMMAGTYLDVSTERDRAQAEIAKEKHEIEQKPEQEAQKVRDRLLQAGFTQADTEVVLTVIQRTPGATLKEEAAFELHIDTSADQNPWVQSIWMFVSDLFAAFVPVLPFAFLPLGSARTLSLVVTTVLLLLLGIGRGIIGHKNVVVTALQTLSIAAAAGVAGLLVGTLITGRLRG
jgi:VIT1/CCC1 family predicted Fe2+/Mn2+ transporter